MLTYQKTQKSCEYCDEDCKTYPKQGYIFMAEKYINNLEDTGKITIFAFPIINYDKNGVTIIGSYNNVHYIEYQNSRLYYNHMWDINSFCLD